MVRPEPLSEELRRLYGRTPAGTYKLNSDQKIQIKQRLRAFQKIKSPTEVQKRELYRMRAALRGQVKPLRRDVGGADVGLFGGKPGPHQILAGAGIASLGGTVAAPTVARALLPAMRKGAGLALAKALGSAAQTVIMGPGEPTGGKDLVKRAERTAAVEKAQDALERMRKALRKIPLGVRRGS